MPASRAATWHRTLQHVAIDVLQILRTVAAMARWGAQHDQLTIALAAFRALSPRARAGEISTYEILVTNAGPVDVLARLVLDIYRCDDHTHPSGHYGFVEHTVIAPRRRTLHVGIAYDWQHSAQVTVDGVTLPADGVWRGLCVAPGKYTVTAVLAGSPELEEQRLSVLQELA
ncbi:MAG: hypothetical protein AB7V27_15300 [Candidatus Binatia bacterium]